MNEKRSGAIRKRVLRRAGMWLVLMIVWVMAEWPARAQNSAPNSQQETQRTAFDHFVIEGGFITWGILIPLSMLAFGLCIEHAIRIRRKKLLPDGLRLSVGEMLQQQRYKEVLEVTAADPSLLGAVLHAGLSQANGGLPAMERAMDEVLESRAAGLFRHIEYLNIIGNVSPMIGLFGTIYGMILTFTALVELGGTPDPKVLADGIAIALVTTFWGLVIAIPALAVFHLLRNRIDALLADCAVQAEELLYFFKPLGRGTLVIPGDRPAKSSSAVSTSVSAPVRPGA